MGHFHIRVRANGQQGTQQFSLKCLQLMQALTKENVIEAHLVKLGVVLNVINATQFLKRYSTRTGNIKTDQIFSHCSQMSGDVCPEHLSIARVRTRAVPVVKAIINSALVV
jgi:hypothetical protein